MKHAITVESLSRHQDRYDELITLIEETFEYSNTFKFDIDFLPLVHSSNWENCFLIFSDDQLIGHIGYIPKKFSYQNIDLKCAFIGGVCIKKTFQGQGIFKFSMNHILEKIKEVALIFLWSGHENGYQNFHFYESGQIYQTGNLNLNFNSLSEFNHSKLNKVSSDIRQRIIASYIYSSSKYIVPQRSSREWEIIFNMSSIDVYYKTNSENKFSYFFANKGQDLTDIIHEFGASDFEEENKLIETIKKFKLWSPKKLNTDQTITIFLANIRIQNKKTLFDWAEKIGYQLKNEMADKEIIDQIFNSNIFVFYIPGCDSI